jgi:Transmembrane domain of unknown function (DUF3566)
VSVIGAEEDGVDNRVEAPAWASDGGSESSSQGRQADNINATSEDSLPSAAATAKSGGGSNGHQAAADPGWRQAAGSRPAGGAAPQGSPSAQWNSAGQQGSTYGPGQRSPSQTTPLPAAVGAAAGAARGLASRVSAPFSGLTKPKAKGAKRPVDAGLPPRPSGWPQARVTQQGGPQARRAQLRLDRIEPWSVMKFSFLISLVGWVILFVAVAILYFAMSKLGVFTSIEHTVGLVTTNKSNPTGSNAASWFKASRILGYTMLIGAVNVVLMTALATIGAVLYNLVTMLAGGIEITLKESD